jgi:hypothetical protein
MPTHTPPAIHIFAPAGNAIMMRPRPAAGQQERPDRAKSARSSGAHSPEPPRSSPRRRASPLLAAASERPLPTPRLPQAIPKECRRRRPQPAGTVVRPPSRQQRSRNPETPCRRRNLPVPLEALLEEANLLLVAPSPSASDTVDRQNLKPRNDPSACHKARVHASATIRQTAAARGIPNVRFDLLIIGLCVAFLAVSVWLQYRTEAGRGTNRDPTASRRRMVRSEH